MIFHLSDCVIKKNEELSDEVFLLEFEAPQIATSFSPGQFLMIKTSNSVDSILRRPFSIFREYEERSIGILYRVIGKGTRWLSQRKAGHKLDVLGPLGKGFEIIGDAETHIVISGGIGIAAVSSLVSHLVKNSLKDRLIFITGSYSREIINWLEEIGHIPIKAYVTTEDGSYGYKGRVTDILEDILDKRDIRRGACYACGPIAMLNNLYELSSRYELSLQVALEANMACGIGLCQGCSVRGGHGGYRKVCKDGPVFYASELAWPLV